MTMMFSFAIVFVNPRLKIFEKNFLRWLKHAVFVMHTVVRIVTVVCTIRKGRAKWINI